MHVSFVVSFATDLDVARGALCTDKATFLGGLLPPEVLSHFGLVQVVFFKAFGSRIV